MSRNGTPSGTVAPTVDRARLLAQWHFMDARNRALGLTRYDWGDVRSHPFLLKASRHRLGRVLQKALQIPELAAPVTWRKALRLAKRLVPSVFYHLGLSYLAREKLIGVAALDRKRTDEMCAQALAVRLDAEHVCWKHPYEHHAAVWRDPSAGNGKPPSCAHHTARVGLMLLEVGKAHGGNELNAMGQSAAGALLHYHNWHFYGDGSCTVSYYPSSQDEVVNTGADAAALLASLPADGRTDLVQGRLNGLVGMIVAEQQADGSWHYCTSRHYKRFGGKRIIDNHHSAMILTALARVLASESLPPELHEAARKAWEKGLRFYLRAFYMHDGTGLHFPRRARRANVVGYSEGVSTLCASLRLGRLLPEKLLKEAARMLPKILAKATREFLDAATGDVACARYFGRRYHIQSARWGSAPLMQAITDYLASVPGDAPP